MLVCKDAAHWSLQVTAIANYTQRVNDPSLGATQVMQALYFIDHVSLYDQQMNLLVLSYMVQVPR
jgi:hypothetical protein